MWTRKKRDPDRRPAVTAKVVTKPLPPVGYSPFLSSGGSQSFSFVAPPPADIPKKPSPALPRRVTEFRGGVEVETERQRQEQQRRAQEGLERRRLAQQQAFQQRRAQMFQEEQRLAQLQEQQRVAQLQEQQRVAQLQEQQRLIQFQEQQRVTQFQEQQRLAQLQEQQRLAQLQQKIQANAERARAIAAYMEQQKKWGIPDTLHVKLNDQEQLQIYRNPSEPDEFWVNPQNRNRGIGKLVLANPGAGPAAGFMLQWTQVDERNPLIIYNRTYQISDQPFPIITDKLPPPKMTERRPSKSGDGIQVKITPEIQRLAEQESELRRKEEALTQKLKTPKRVLEEEQEDIRSQAEMQERILAAARARRLEIERREKEKKRAQLRQERKEFSAKRARELEQEKSQDLKEVIQLEEERKEQLKRLKEELRLADPETLGPQLQKEIMETRQLLERSELARRQNQAVSKIQQVLKERLFEGDRRKSRTLDELLANLPNRPLAEFLPTLREFASKWAPPTREGEPIDREEYLIPVKDQKSLVSAYLCGFADAFGNHVPGYFEEVLGLDREQCEIVIL